MNLSVSLSEIAATFPGRDLAVSGQPNKAEWVGVRDAVCKECGKSFAYTPGLHAYTRRAYSKKRNQTTLYFCSWHCLRAWDEKKRNPLETKVEEDRKLLRYLYAQAELPAEERDEDLQGKLLYPMIRMAEDRLNTALNRIAKGAGLA